MMNLPKWTGVFPAVTTQMHQDQSLDLAATWMKLDSYDESGAGDFDLSVAGSSSWVLSAAPAVS